MVNVILGQVIRKDNVLLVYRMEGKFELHCYHHSPRPHWVIDVLVEEGDVLYPSAVPTNPLKWLITMDPGEGCRCGGGAGIGEGMASLGDARLTELYHYMVAESPFAIINDAIRQK